MRRTTAVVMTIAASALAGVLASSAAAAPAVGAQCAAVLDVSADAWRYLKNADDGCYTGSTAKTLTLHVGLHEQAQGTIAENDSVAFSQKSRDQACNCIGGFAVDQDPANDNGPDDTIFEPFFVAQVGEVMNPLQDVHHGIAMSAAQPTVSLAEHVAQKHFNQPAATTVEESTALELDFVELMNEHADHAGAADETHFENEHGGDDALDGGDDPQASARDMVKIWRHAAQQDPRFLDTLGLRSEQISNALPGGGQREYAFWKGYGYYPSIDADKGGGSTGCMTCLVSQATRLGRTVIVDVMQSYEDWYAHYGDDTYVEQDFTDGAHADSGRLYDDAFDEIFEPDRRGDSGDSAGQVAGHALDCWGTDRCITAVRTNDDDLKAIGWRAEIGAQDFDKFGGEHAPGVAGRVAAVDVAHAGVVSGPLPTAGGGYTTGTRDGTRARAASASSRYPSRRVAVSVIERTPQAGAPDSEAGAPGGSGVDGGDGIRLDSWRFDSAGKARHMKWAATVPGTDPRITRLRDGRVAVSFRDAAKRLRVETWRVAYNGTLTLLDSDTTQGGVLASHAIAATNLGFATALLSDIPAEGPGGLPGDVGTQAPAPPQPAPQPTPAGERTPPTAAGSFTTGARPRSAGGGPQVKPYGTFGLIEWNVAADGTIDRAGSASGPEAHAVGMARQGARMVSVALVLAKPGDVLGDRDLRVSRYRVEAGGSWSGQGSMGPFGHGASEATVAPLASGQLAGIVDGGAVKLYPMEYSAYYDSDKGPGSPEDYFRMGKATTGSASQLDVAALGTNAATGDFVTAVRTASGRLKLIGWRVGAP